MQRMLMTKERRGSNQINTAIGLSVNDTVKLHGSANAEFLKGLRGVDYESGIVFDRSLLKVSQSKVNEEFAAQNIKQQAGYSAEIASVSRKNGQMAKSDAEGLDKLLRQVQEK